MKEIDEILIEKGISVNHDGNDYMKYGCTLNKIKEAMEEYASQLQGNKDAIIEKQGEIIKRGCKHSSGCYLNQDWQEAIDALNDTPQTYRDADWHEAVSDICNKMKTCSCGLEQLESELSSLQSDKAEGTTEVCQHCGKDISDPKDQVILCDDCAK